MLQNQSTTIDVWKIVNLFEIPLQFLYHNSTQVNVACIQYSESLKWPN